MGEKCLYCGGSELETVKSWTRPRADGQPGAEKVSMRKCKDYQCQRVQPEPVITPMTSSLAAQIED